MLSEPELVIAESKLVTSFYFSGLSIDIYLIDMYVIEFIANLINYKNSAKNTHFLGSIFHDYLLH